MKKKQTHSQTKNSVTTSALLGAAVVASLGAMAAGFASIEPRATFSNQVASTSQPVPTNITSSTPFSYLDFVNAGYSISTSSERTKATIQNLQGGEILEYKKQINNNIKEDYLLYLSKTDGLAYRLGYPDNLLAPKWKDFAKKNKVKVIDDHIQFNNIVNFYETKKQGVKNIKFIPGNQIFIYNHYSEPTKQLYAFYGANKVMYKLPTKADGTLLAEVLPLLSSNPAGISTKGGIIQTWKVDETDQPNFNFLYTNDKIKIIPFPTTNIAELKTFLADKNQQAATNLWGNDLQKLVKSYWHN